ncbi:MAG TPA: flagellar biosynthetic protein FliQ [Candidatus Acidoferrales bacterium]|nr:flagellar biosynthetic protein FliQ [Candidatus Acidoferrales bacterium]
MTLSATLIDLYTMALATAALLALPVVALVALVGVLVGIAQTVLGISDQNVSFGPKIALVIAACAWGGPLAFSMLSALFRAAMQALPQLGR